MFKLIVFDWDDVFTLGSKEGYIKCLHDTLVALHVHLDSEEEHRRILATWSQPHELELKNLLQERPDLVEQACEIYEEKFFGGTFVSALKYVDGANQLLEKLKDDYILAVATGAHPKVLHEEVMPMFNVPNVFNTIISGYEIDDPDKNKPHPYMLEEIMRINSCRPTETLFVGDAKSDVQMARSAGVIPVVVLTGHLAREQAKELGVEYIIDDVTKLTTILDKFK